MTANSEHNADHVLQRIVGARLTSVDFVMNYLILGFDEKGALTTLVWPECIDGLTVKKWGEPGYRDSLCGMITRHVERVTIEAGDTIRIRFEGDAAFVIPLHTYRLRGDRAIFTAPGGVFRCWTVYP